MTIQAFESRPRRSACRAPLFRAVQVAARDGVSRRSFASRTGLTRAEVMMVERASGVRLSD